MDSYNPLAIWRRFLAQPIDSRGKTILVAFLVSASCAALVSGATVFLRPIQMANRAAEQAARLEALLSAVPGMDQILTGLGDGELTTVVVDLDTGKAASGIAPNQLQAALEGPENWTTLAPERDVAEIGSRPNYAQVYFLREGGEVALAILPIFGSGYGGTIEAMIALRGDMNTIAGLTVTTHSETPGLGARIEEPAWLLSFAGKQIADDTGAVRFAVARAQSSGVHEVDGISGATRTGNAITRIVRFWLGPDGFGPLMQAVRRGEY